MLKEASFSCYYQPPPPSYSNSEKNSYSQGQDTWEKMHSSLRLLYDYGLNLGIPWIPNPYFSVVEKCRLRPASLGMGEGLSLSQYLAFVIFLGLLHLVW